MFNSKTQKQSQRNEIDLEDVDIEGEMVNIQNETNIVFPKKKKSGNIDANINIKNDKNVSMKKKNSNVNRNKKINEKNTKKENKSKSEEESEDRDDDNDYISVK